MTPERWRQITETFHAALVRGGEARSAFLSEACAADPDLRGEVDALLAAHRDAEGFGERPAFEAGDLTAGDGPAAGEERLPARHLFVWIVAAIGAVMLGLFAYAAREIVEQAIGVTPAATQSFAGRVAHFGVSLIWCLMAVFVGLARPDLPMARLASLAGFATAQVFLDVGVIESGISVAPIHTAIGFHFFCRFPSGPIPRGPWKAALVVLYLASFVSVAMRLWAGGPVPRVGFIAFTGTVVGMLAVIPYKYRELTGADERRRVRWVIYGSIVGLAPNLWYVVASTWLGGVTPGLSLLANGASVALPLCMAYAVARHRVLDIRVVVRRGLRYLLARRALQAGVTLPLAVLAGTVIVQRHHTVAEIVTRNTGYLIWVGLAAVALRYRRPIQAWLDRRFFREQLDREQILLGLLDDVGRLDSISELSRLVTSKLDAALHPKAMYLWYRDPREFAAACSADPLLTPPDFPAEGRWLSWLEGKGETTALPSRGEAGLSREEARWFAEREVSLMVPITDSGDRVVGALLLGDKRSEEPYGPNDRRLLQAMARQAAVVRENLRLRARVSEEQRIRHDVLARLDRGMPGLLKECPACGGCFDGTVDSCDRDGQALLLTLPVARTLDGRYRLDRLIGKGGMGAVYEAGDLRLGRTVAVKILLGRAFGQPTALRRFRREAQAAARLNHPNIVSVYDFGPLEGEGAYLVMERVDGVTLRVALERMRVLPHAVAGEWFGQILDGLAAAHAQGVVHRDLKPENVIAREGGRGAAVKILDFGLAKFRAADPASGTVTREGVVLGTLGYMSPEQILGRDADQRADIFAVGVMLVEALTGGRPFDGGREADLTRTLPSDRPLLPASTRGAVAVEAVLRRCLAHDPSDRYVSALALRAELLPALAAEP